MPAKSNKFDFTNRSSRGLKMGGIIEAALEKEAEKIIKDAEKHSQKLRKQSDGSSQMEVGEDAYTHITHLDIRAPGKDLGDEGAIALITGLRMALQKGTKYVALVLEDLNLANNNITTTTLRQLASVICLAGKTLSSLNLSNNLIRVASEKEAEDWYIFISSFQHCRAFRRLDLSHNVELGPKAFEILAQLHNAAELVAPITGYRSEGNKDDGDGADASESAGHDSTNGDLSLSVLQDHSSADTRRGLRSVPYIILNDVGLTDAGALWLSYVVEEHFYPSQLLLDLGSARTDPTNMAPPRDGIDWSGNEDTLGKDGRVALTQAEDLRRRLLQDDAQVEYDDKPVAHNTEDGTANQAGVPSRAAGRTRSQRGSVDDEQELHALESLRRKLARSIIVSTGADSVDLWRAALQVVKLSRALTFDVGVPPQLRVMSRSQGDTNVDNRNGHNEALQTFRSHRSKTPIKPPRPLVLGADTPNSDPLTGRPIMHTNHSSILREEFALLSGLTSPRYHNIEHSRSDAFSDGGDLPGLESKLASLAMSSQAVPSHTPSPKAKVQEPYRDTSIPSHLTRKALYRIIKAGLSGREADALTPQQFDRAFTWGAERKTLKKEMEWRKDHDSIQILKLLEQLGCLEYAHQ